MTNKSTSVYIMPILLWVIVSAGLALAVASAYSALVDMVGRWESSEEYGYGYMIPVIALFLIWQRKDKLELLPFTGSKLGVILLLSGVLVTLVGQLSTLYTITQYGFVITVLGAAYALMGWSAFKLVAVPLLLLFLMVPLPGFVFNNLSAQLQLVSSQIGVAVIRLFDISVHLEGNVIDLGNYKLQVVEACSGLRYLFPLTALSIIASYFYQAAVWKKILVILSSIPITVLMNSFRIGVIGVMVEFYGIEQAEGFLHDFEGWFVFMACVALLVFEMWLLSFVGKNRRPFRETFGMDFPETNLSDDPQISRRAPPHAYVAMIILVAGAAGAVTMSGRAEIVPEREHFANFPTRLGEWRGQNDVLDSEVLDVLKLDDYIISDYRNPDGKAVNFYVAYYGSQRSGASAHSPRTCLPGGGWRIESHTQVDLGEGLKSNRFVIRNGEDRMLVYYWFKQRDRIITSEYAVKWYLFWDSMTRNRTDGALIRLTTMIGPNEDIRVIEQRMQEFAKTVNAPLSRFVPG